MSSYNPRRPVLRITNPDPTTDNRDVHRNVHFLDEHPVFDEPSASPYNYTPPKYSSLKESEPQWRKEARDWFSGGSREQTEGEQRGASQRHWTESPLSRSGRGMGDLPRPKPSPSAFTSSIRDDIPHPYSSRGDSPVLPLESVRITTGQRTSLDNFEDREEKKPSYTYEEEQGYEQQGRPPDDGFRATLKKATSHTALRKLSKPLPPIPGKDPPSTSLFTEDKTSSIPDRPPLLGSFDFEKSLDLFGGEDSAHLQKPSSPTLDPRAVSRSPVLETRPISKMSYSPPESPRSQESRIRLGTIEEHRLLTQSIQTGRLRQERPRHSEDLFRTTRPSYKESSTQTCDIYETPRRMSQDEKDDRPRYHSQGVQNIYDIHPLNRPRATEDDRFQPDLYLEDRERFRKHHTDQPHKSSQAGGVGAPYGIPASPAAQFTTSPSRSPPHHPSQARSGYIRGRETPPVEPSKSDRRRRKSASGVDLLKSRYPEQRDQPRSSTSDLPNANGRIGPYGVAGFQSLSSSALPTAPLPSRPQRRGSHSTTEASPPTPPDDVRSLVSDNSENPFSDRYRTPNRRSRKHRKEEHGKPRLKQSQSRLKVSQADSDDVDLDSSKSQAKMWKKVKHWGSGLKIKFKKSKEANC